MVKKKPSSRKAAKRKSASRKSATKKPALRTSAPSSPLKHALVTPTYGWITHTELASADPDATKAWCAKALGWRFMPSMPTPEGDYHLFVYSDTGGGGIRRHNPPEVPGSIPYVHVADAKAAFDKALREGAEEMFPPT